MAMQKLKKDDTVIVITGKDKGRVGKILSVNPKIKKAANIKTNNIIILHLQFFQVYHPSLLIQQIRAQS